jgi:hypothetical protein
MMGIDQRIVAERRQTFGEAVDGALLNGSEPAGDVGNQRAAPVRLSKS